MKLSKQITDKIVELYRSGKNVKQIQLELNFKYHQPVYNTLRKVVDYIPYKEGRGAARTYTLNEDYFNSINSNEQAYIFGFICADGHVDTKCKRLKITIQTLDKELLEKIRFQLSSNAKVKDFIKKSYFSYGRREFQHSSIEFCSAKLVKDLVKFGLVSDKTPVLDRNIVNCIPKQFIRDFIRGYFDGDGSVIISKNLEKISIEIMANYDLIEGVFQVNFPTNTKVGKAKRSRHSYYYRITKRSEILRFLHYIYKDSTIYLKRKYDKYLFLCGHLKPFELLETQLQSVGAISSEA